MTSRKLSPLWPKGLLGAQEAGLTQAPQVNPGNKGTQQGGHLVPWDHP